MIKKLNLKYANEVLEGIESLPKGSVLLANLQTGTGKTSVIFGTKDGKGNKIEGLIDKIPSDKKLIYLCNRSALKLQVLQDLYKMKDKELSDNIEDLDYQVGNVRIMSYQAMEKKIDFKIANQRRYPSDEYFSVDDYDYIVADEAHYLISDALFNRDTNLSFLELLMREHKNSVLIFLTATDSKVKILIENLVHKRTDKEGNQLFLKNKIQMKFLQENIGIKKYYYRTSGIDYSYVNTKYFTNENDMITLIKNSPTNEKWIWFVTRKEDGRKYVKTLKELNISAVFVDKNSKRAKAKIVKNSAFEERVLVCTKALDNGINIKDEAVKNVIIQTYDEITFKQELGRIRIPIDNPRQVNLFIDKCIPKQFNISKENKDTLELFKKYDVCEDKKGFFNNATGINNRTHMIGFGQYDGEFKAPNRLFRECLELETEEKLIIASKLNSDEWYFIKLQLSWLGLENTFSEDNLIQNVVDNEEVDSLEEFLEYCYQNNIEFLKKEDRTPLIEKIGLVDESHSNFSKGIIKYVQGINTLNSYLIDLGLSYEIVQLPETRRNNKKYKAIWKIRKLF